MTEDESHRRKSAFKRTAKAVIDKGLAGNQGDYVWLV